MDEHVLDASAILASVLREDGWQRVDSVERRCASSVNVAESASALTEKGFSFHAAQILVWSLRLHVIDFDEAQAMEAARLRPITRAFGLSLGDRACLALAAIRGLPVLTADHSWQEAAPHLTIKQIR